MATLQQAFQVDEHGVSLNDLALILSGSADPTAGGGEAAPVGSFYCRTNGQAYKKTGNLNTSWTELIDASFLPKFYFHQNLQNLANVKVWSGQANTNASGVAQFFPTTTNAVGGTALFTTIYSIQLTVIANVAIAYSVPFASVKAVAGDLKTIDVNVVRGRNMPILLLGTYPSMEFVPAGVTVLCHITGI